MAGASVVAVLVRQRNARRDTALGRLGAARAAYEGCRAQLLAHARDLEQAIAWSESVRDGQGMASDPRWRRAALPSCEALIEGARVKMAHAQIALEAAERTVLERRQALADCERALLRTDELASLERGARNSRELLGEQDLDDDLAAGWRPAPRAVGP